MALTEEEKWAMYTKPKTNELNRSADLYNQKNQMLDTNLATQQAGLARAKTNAQQGASIANDKLNKYLGQKNLRSGVATGQTGSDFIQANNNYMQNRAGISNDFSARQAELLNFYATGKWQNEADKFSADTAIGDKWYDREQNERLLQQQQYDSGLQDVKDLLQRYYFTAQEDGKIDEAEQSEWERLMAKYSPTYGDKLSTSQSEWDSYKGTSAAQAAAAEAAKPKWGEYTSDDIRLDKEGKNFSLTFDGNKYTDLETGSTAPSEAMKAAAQSKVPNNTLFIYKGNIYVKTTDGARFIGGQGTWGYDSKGSGSGKTQYENLYAALQKSGHVLG